jgi:hypothetical protein
MSARVLARSEHFTVEAEYEYVWVERSVSRMARVAARLTGRSSFEWVPVGRHYGDAEAAAIDDEERWCVTVGCGAVVYRLGPPWSPYWESHAGQNRRALGLSTRGQKLWKWARASSQPVTDQWWEAGNGDDPGDHVWLDEVRHVAGDRFEATGVSGRFEIRAEEKSFQSLEHPE